MSLYDRSYMRASNTRNQWNPVTWLIAINIAVYLFQSISWWWFGSDMPQHVFALHIQNLQNGYVWAFLTYGFMHSILDPMHLVLNMLGLFFIGRILQDEMPAKKFYFLYAFSTLLGGLLFTLIRTHGTAPLVGASAAVMGILTVFCLRHAEENITLLLFFVLPVNMKPRILLWGLIAIELFMLMPEIQGLRSIASSAHLGGILGGFLFEKFLCNSLLLNKLCSDNAATIVEPKPFTFHSSSPRKPQFKVNISNRTDLKKEVDRILDKINSKGFGALSSEEKSTLDRAREILKK